MLLAGKVMTLVPGFVLSLRNVSAVPVLVLPAASVAVSVWVAGLVGLFVQLYVLDV